MRPLGPRGNQGLKFGLPQPRGPGPGPGPSPTSPALARPRKRARARCICFQAELPSYTSRASPNLLHRYLCRPRADCGTRTLVSTINCGRLVRMVHMPLPPACVCACAYRGAGRRQLRATRRPCICSPEVELLRPTTGVTGLSLAADSVPVQKPCTSLHKWLLGRPHHSAPSWPAFSGELYLYTARHGMLLLCMCRRPCHLGYNGGAASDRGARGARPPARPSPPYPIVGPCMCVRVCL